MINNPNRIVIPGGSGFLGRIGARWFSERGWEVIVLARDPAKVQSPARAIPWDGRTIDKWADSLEGATAVLNLAGRSVNCRYHAANRALMINSRVDSTRILGQAIAACNNPPAVWLNSSTATIYEHTYGAPWDETGEVGADPQAKDAFSIEVARAWENAFDAAQTPRTRKLTLRSAMVFGIGAGGVYQVLRRLARLGLGGTLAGGRQFVSWIHEHDFCRAIEWLIDNDHINGIVNIAAPNPLPNRQMMRLLRSSVRMPIGLPAARWMLEVGSFFLRTETELVIKSRRVIPGLLLREGFKFDFSELEPALSELALRARQRR